MSPLHLAAWAGQVEVARLMVEKGAEVNMRSSTGDTPLHLACQHGNIEVVINCIPFDKKVGNIFTMNIFSHTACRNSD